MTFKIGDRIFILPNRIHAPEGLGIFVEKVKDNSGIELYNFISLKYIETMVLVCDGNDILKEMLK